MGTTMFASGHLRRGSPVRPRANSSDRYFLPSMRPSLASAAYILARPRPVTTPLAAGTSPSRNGVSPLTRDMTPGKYIAPRAPENGRPATFGAMKLNTGARSFPCGIRICAALVGEPSGGRPRCTPSVLSGRATSWRISSRMPLPVTARASAGQQPSVGQRVIRLHAAQMIDGRRGQALLHDEVIHQLRLGDAPQVRQPGSMPQDVANRDVAPCRWPRTPASTRRPVRRRTTGRGRPAGESPSTRRPWSPRTPWRRCRRSRARCRPGPTSPVQTSTTGCPSM